MTLRPSAANTAVRPSLLGRSASAPDEGREYLIDRWGRRHTDLRISVTDRCNLRCWYCMPVEGVELLPRQALLDFDEIERVVRVAVRLGIRKVRLTGGEPLLRKDLPRLVERLASLPGLEDLAMTTNGTLLAEYAPALREAGLRRLNISLDTLDRRQFQALTGQDALPEVLRGIEAAQQAGFQLIKLNALAIRGWSEPQIIPLVRFALERGLEIRFIEFMPIGPTGQWSPDRVLPAQAILEMLRQEFGSVEPIEGSAPSGWEAIDHQGQQVPGSQGMGQQGAGGQPVAPTGFPPGASAILPIGFERAVTRPPARLYHLGRTGAQIGIIASVTAPFCSSCCRLRITAQGELRYCLFAQTGWDLRRLLREGASDEQLVQMFQAAVAAKSFSPQKMDEFPHTGVLMCQIGG